ncbi:MAG: acyl-CoA dehydratase activase-related protein, partial [Nitrospirota bacterium]|nr:acyl-CoA dehydratase activase-related protein [Nitrospirota bacterium]
MKNRKIGIPRALLYFSYAHTWKALFRELGYETIISPETSSGILKDGLKKGIGDLCLPVKTYLGHIKSLKDNVDYLFIPRYVSVEQDAYMCPKVIGLPDMVKACFSHLPEIISPMMNVKIDRESAPSLFSKKIAGTLNISRRDAEKAFLKASELPMEPHPFMKNGNTAHCRGDRGIRIGIIGRNYLAFDRFLVKNLFQTLLEFGVEPVYVQPPEEEIREAMTVIPKWVYWSMGREVVTSAHMFFKDCSIDGVINICSAACGP